MGIDQEARPQTCASHRRCPAKGRTRGTPRRPSTSLSPMVSPCWVRQFKCPPGLDEFPAIFNSRFAMKIAVCIKQVPTRDWQPRLNESKTWIREQDASYEMNEPDAYALEESLRLKEKHSGEVVVCSAGPARVSQVIREALARGADRAVH